MVILRVCVCVVLCVSSPAKSVRALRVYNFYTIAKKKSHRTRGRAYSSPVTLSNSPRQPTGGPAVHTALQHLEALHQHRRPRKVAPSDPHHRAR